MLSRRQSLRLPSLLEGWITVDGQVLSIPCTIHDLSATGARIWLQDVTNLPSEFGLTISALGQTVQVRPVWSENRTIGVVFAKMLDSPVVSRIYSQSVGASGLRTNPGAELRLPNIALYSNHLNWLRSFGSAAADVSDAK